MRGEHPEKGPEEARRTRYYDHFLSADTPVCAASYADTSPTSLESDYHAGFELGIVLEGEQERRFGEVCLTCRPGDVWLCAGWEPHEWRITAPGTGHVVLIFLPEFLGEAALEGVPWLYLFTVPPALRPAVVAQSMRQRVLALGRELRREIQREPADSFAGLRTLALDLLLVLRRAWDLDPERLSAHPRTVTGDLSRLRPAMTLLRTQPGRRISTQEAAAACSLSEPQFRRVFTRTLGLSFVQFALHTRLAYAAGQLLNSHLSVETIAVRAGFADGSHFHRAFARWYGCTPGEYRTARAPAPTPRETSDLRAASFIWPRAASR